MREQFEASLAKIAEDLTSLSWQNPSWATVAARSNATSTDPTTNSRNTSQENSQSVSPFSSVSQEKAVGFVGIGPELGAM